MKDAQTLNFPSDLFDRHQWRKGKWTTEHDVYIWVDSETNYDCLIVRHRLGYLSGYVGVTEQHPLYGLSTSEPLVAALKIHGNSIWSDSQIREKDEDYLLSIPLVLTQRKETLWWLGFGCYHDLDLIPCLFSLSPKITEGESYKDVEYVTKEIISLARQLKILESRELVNVLNS